MQNINLYIFFRVLIIAASTSLVACASTPSSNLDNAKLTPLNEPASPGKSNIDIYRTDDALYLGVKARVDINGERVAELWRGESFSADYDPGRFVVTTDAWSSPGEFTVVFNTEPDTEYTLEISPRGELMKSAGFGIVGLMVDAEVSENSGPFKITLKKVNRNEQTGTTSLPVKPVSQSNSSSIVSEKISTVSHQEPNSLENKLNELKYLHESGLIAEDVYLDQQRKLLDVNQLQ